MESKFEDRIFRKGKLLQSRIHCLPRWKCFYSGSPLSLQNLALQWDALAEAGCGKIFAEQLSGAVTDRPASDSFIVAVKSLNKTGGPAVEAMEQRAGAEENAPQQRKHRTQSRERCHRRRSTTYGSPRDVIVPRACDAPSPWNRLAASTPWIAVVSASSDIAPSGPRPSAAAPDSCGRSTAPGRVPTPFA
jgi:hypothetical protein